MAVIHGWTVFAHPLLLDQLEKLTAAVEALKRKDPEGYSSSANAKLLAALLTLMFSKIPGDPTSPAYVQGKTLGPDRRHWFRAKFGAGRFRLFYRYSSKDRIIIFAGVNDENSLRTYGSKTDAYAVFKSMLNDGNPPDGWDALMREVTNEKAMKRFDDAKPSAGKD